MYETIRIIEDIKPKYVIWENVKNILSEQHRHNFNNYLRIMSSLGYINYYKVLNAKDYGIPQNRERVYTISIRKDVNKIFYFPEKWKLDLRLKDMLENEVDEKYYLTEKNIKHYNRQFGSKGRMREEICDTLQAAMGCGGGNVPIIKTDKCVQVGNLQGGKWDKINESCRRVYLDAGISPTIHTCEGGNTEPKIVTHNISQVVKVRKYPVNTKRLVEILRNAKEKSNLTNKQISKKINIPLTQVEHYFRTDSSFAIPEPSIWKSLKKVLKIETNEFDESIMIFEEKEGIYEKTNRIYDECGVAPTLTCENEKIIADYKIRKLTPKECWRLMGFDDKDFEKVKSVGISGSQLYKQAGNSIVVNVLEAIFTELFLEHKFKNKLF